MIRSHKYNNIIDTDYNNDNDYSVTVVFLPIGSGGSYLRAPDRKSPLSFMKNNFSMNHYNFSISIH